MRFKTAAAVLLGSALLVGCGPDGPTRSDTGLAVGAIAGGILGNQVGSGSGRVLATVAGAVVGGVVGSEIGRALDRQDQMFAQEAEFEALERGSSGERRRWRNPESGHYGEVVPGERYRRGSADCRDYTHTIYIDGEPEMMRGTACRNRDGTWENVG